MILAKKQGQIVSDVSLFVIFTTYTLPSWLQITVRLFSTARNHKSLTHCSFARQYAYTEQYEQQRGKGSFPAHLTPGYKISKKASEQASDVRPEMHHCAHSCCCVGPQIISCHSRVSRPDRLNTGRFTSRRWEAKPAQRPGQPRPFTPGKWERTLARYNQIYFIPENWFKFFFSYEPWFMCGS